MGKIDKDIDFILAEILEGKSTFRIAKENGWKKTTLTDFLAKSDHSARVEKARKLSAETFADMAEEVLLNAESNAVEIARARELSQYYRWRARVSEPKKYGDKVDVTSDGEKLNQTVTIVPFGNMPPLANSESEVENGEPA